jgi:phosphopantetheine adenylyltransferase
MATCLAQPPSTRSRPACLAAYQADLRDEYPLSVMNEALGVTTLLVPARPELARVSSTAVRR